MTMAEGNVTVAVKVGYNFALVPVSELRGITLKDTGSRVSVGGQDHALLAGRTYEDSRMLDDVLDAHGELAVNDHLIAPQEATEPEVYTVVVEYEEPDGGGGGYEVGRAPEGSPELAELVERATQDVDD